MTTRFVRYEVVPVIDDGKYARSCINEPERADFWSVFGYLPNNSFGASLAICIGDFNSKEAAELVIELISGQAPT